MKALRLVTFAVAWLLACGATETKVPDTPKDVWRKAPPKPGSSITHTKLCECRTCSPAQCCQGTEPRRGSESCGDGYDFSKEGCGLDVESCTGRCSKHVWRVPLSEGCDAEPAQCC